MNANIASLIQACRELGCRYAVRHDTQNLVVVENKFFFANWSTPFITHSLGRIMQDKDYTYNLLHDVVRMPLTISYLSPGIDEVYRKYLKYGNVREIVSDIERRLSYPLVLKRNAGSQGSHVFLCEKQKEAAAALAHIFNERDREWDYVALAQQYVRPKAEYRAIFFDGGLAFAYRKDVSKAGFTGNLSPLHWEGARAVLLDDARFLDRIEKFIQPAFSALPAAFCGADIIQDEENSLWLIELNGSPCFDVFVRDNGNAKIVELYRRILAGLLDKG